MSKAKLGSALHKFRKQMGVIEEPRPAPRFSIKHNKPATSRIANPNKSHHKPTSWCHEKYGVIDAIISDLVRMFPQEGLSESGLSRVKTGKQAHHKGWTLFKKDDKVTPYYKDLMERGA